ncbi:hypothetical protein TRAPUB_4841 [Trametes pubescens]|uniref:Uncharacterized protein n=1 Tax=Trametes pubescens TaxID=154538 RepID=A0A1M2VAA7_TRAPU|nr:hypothetical protein TRAPUB_4841 [Trametes pubescens]
MPAFTSPASLRRLSRAGSVRTSARALAPPEPTPAPATTSPTADAEPAPEALTSPRPLSPLLHAENDGVIFKAVRAYERDRQRSKKTKERTERERERERQRAAAATGTTSPDGRPCRHCPSNSTSTSARRTGLALSLTSASTKEDASLAHGTPGSPLVEEIIADVVERETRARGSLEVHLAQLVKPAKARRSKAGEFELVPAIPLVIALDDALADDAELDEPWEHISADELDEKRAAPPSYATVVASTA